VAVKSTCKYCDELSEDTADLMESDVAAVPHAERPSAAATIPAIQYLRTHPPLERLSTDVATSLILANLPPPFVRPCGSRFQSFDPGYPRYRDGVDDAELLERLLAGDARAFAEIVAKYQDSLVRVARYYVANDASAEDVAQETWIAVLKGLERFEGRSSFKTWLFRIAVNRARTKGVKEHRVIAVDFEAERSLLASRFNERGMWSDPPAPFTDSVDDALVNAPIVRLVHESIARLPDVARAVVTLRDVQGLSTTEVAELLELSEANVRVILHRSRARIRSEVEANMRAGQT
jgi:RNA polymerase sigma-70 factor (ECF subfamily)